MDSADQRDVDTRTAIFGVDFSGARNAGGKIWVAEAMLQGQTLRVVRCDRMADRPGARDRDAALAALRHLIKERTHAVFGIDFPFGIPHELHDAPTWPDFVLGFETRYSSPDDFRMKCRAASPARELRRVTDRCRKSPFSPYNLRLYRQTFFGIRDVLAPLIRRDDARILPMQASAAGKTIVLEVCPASTLKTLGQPGGYKGSAATAGDARRQLVRTLRDERLVDSLDPRIVSQVVDDQDGDGLDAILAAVVAADSIARPVHPSADWHAREGAIHDL
jgi:hypothetical protein